MVWGDALLSCTPCKEVCSFWPGCGWLRTRAYWNCTTSADIWGVFGIWYVRVFLLHSSLVEVFLQRKWTRWDGFLRVYLYLFSLFHHKTNSWAGENFCPGPASVYRKLFYQQRSPNTQSLKFRRWRHYWSLHKCSQNRSIPNSTSPPHMISLGHCYITFWQLRWWTFHAVFSCTVLYIDAQVLLVCLSDCSY